MLKCEYRLGTLRRTVHVPWWTSHFLKAGYFSSDLTCDTRQERCRVQVSNGKFSDGVFAIVITLLVLELRPPDVQRFTFSALSSVAPNVFAFVLSFVIVGMYWIA